MNINNDEKKITIKKSIENEEKEKKNGKESGVNVQNKEKNQCAKAKEQPTIIKEEAENNR